MMRFCLPTTVLALLFVPEASSRTWRQIKPYHNVSPQDVVRSERAEIDPFISTPAPPSGTVTNSPTKRATPSPTIIMGPSKALTPRTRMPTRSPVVQPTEKTTPSPTINNYLQSDVPLNPPRGYFNYDVRDSSLYGPGYPALIQGSDGFKIEYQNNGWADAQKPNNYYWDEFGSNGHGPWDGVLASRNMDRNECGNVGLQSPIDIRLSGVACVEHHQIRTRPGDFRVSGASVEKRIESNKLRLVYQRRPCADILDTVCAEPDPPAADFPNGWGGFADMTHVDFKIPAEHRIYGEQFDAEMQIFHLHPGRRRLPAISVLIRVDENAYNTYLQIAIDAFQYEYNLHRAQCADNARKGRRMVAEFHAEIMGASKFNQTVIDYETWGDFSTQLDDPEFIEEGEEHRRRMASEIWYPHHESLIPTYWFYGYDGSLTEPPCTEIVSWFVMDTPMVINPSQLQQMKDILFTHVDENCRSTSSHFLESVARPIQESADRQVWRCTRDDFPPDRQRNN